MKTILLCTTILFACNKFGLSQCTTFNQKIQTPDCSKPTKANMVFLTCSAMEVKWIGSVDQAYEVKAIFKDAITNKVINTTVESGFTCDAEGICTARIAAIEGTKVTWSVQAICLNSNRSFYSYALQGGKDILIPSCKEQAPYPATISKVFPNPSTGEISFEYRSTASGNVQFTVYDMVGNAVFTKSENTEKGMSTTYQFNLSAFSPGIYLLEARNGFDASITKFAIER